MDRRRGLAFLLALVVMVTSCNLEAMAAYNTQLLVEEGISEQSIATEGRILTEEEKQEEGTGEEDTREEDTREEGAGEEGSQEESGEEGSEKEGDEPDDENGTEDTDTVPGNESDVEQEETVENPEDAESEIVDETDAEEIENTDEQTDKRTLYSNDEAATFEVGDMTYEIVSAEEKTVKLKEATGYLEVDLSGSRSREVVVPATVEYESTTYSVVEIGEFAFADYTFEEWNEPGNSAGGDVYKASLAIDKVTVSAGIKKIGRAAFYRSGLINEIILPDTVEEIGAGAFYFNDEQRTLSETTPLVVNIPASVKTIGNSAYHGVHFDDVLKIPNGVQSIGESAFACDGDYSGIYCVEIPASVTTIMKNAFNIQTLQSVAFWNDNPVFESGYNSTNYSNEMFGTKDSSIIIYVPADALEVYRNATLQYYIPNAEYRSLDEYVVLQDSPIRFLCGENVIDSELVIPINTSKTMTVDKGEAEFAFSDIKWSFSFYGENTKLTEEEIANYFTYKANEDGTVIFTAKDKVKNFTIYADVDGYKTVSVNLVLIEGYTNAAFAEAVESLSAEDIEAMAQISAWNTAAESQIAEIKAKAEEVTKECGTDKEKIEAVHRWVSYHISYDSDALYYMETGSNGNGGSDHIACPYTPYSVLQNRYSVCMGYAALAEAMLRSLGIPCARISGYANGDFYGERLGHAWNMAYDKDAGEWIYFDPTWDSKGRVESNYFNSGTGGSSTDWLDFELDLSDQSYREYRNADLAQELVIWESGITERNYYTVFEGDEIKLSCNAGVQATFQTENTDIVSIDSDGTIRGLKPGMAVISAIGESSSSIYDETIYVRVFHNEPFAFEKEEITIGTEDTNCRVDIRYGDKKAWSFVTLQSDNPSVVTVTEEGILEPKAAGTATITAECILGQSGVHAADFTVHVVDGTRYGEDEQFSYFVLTDPVGETNGTVEITSTRLGKKNSTNSNGIEKLTIPSQVVLNGKTYDVVGIGKEAFSKELEFDDILTWVTEYVLPETIQYIDDYAFSPKNCKVGGMNKTINFPASLERIGDGAFASTLLECDVSFLENSQLTYIGKVAFYDNPDMTSLDLSNCKKLQTIDDGAFIYCSRYEDVEWKVSLPEGLETIGERAFFSNEELFRIQLPGTVKTIGNEAFKSTGLKNTVDLSNVESIGEYLFSDCLDMENVILPDELKSVPAGLFYGDMALSRVVTASKAEEAGGIESVETGTVYLPEGVEEIGECAFTTCMAIENVDAKGVKKLGKTAFDACSQLKTVQLSEELKEIPDEAFKLCEKLETFSFSDAIERIGIEAFSECVSLGKADDGAIVLGSELREIADRAFNSVEPDSIRKVTIKSKKIERIGEECFSSKPVFYIYKAVSGICMQKLASCAGGFVYLYEAIFAESIALDRKQAQILVGGTLQLEATVLPADADNTKAAWTSSDTTVAEVDEDGVITAKQKGTAVITAKTTDGTALSDSCTVTVIQPVNEVHISYTEKENEEGTAADYKEILLHSSNQKLFLTATVGPEDADNKEIIWTSSNEQIAVLERITDNSYALNHINGAENEGTTVIRLEAKDGNGAETYVRVVYALNSYHVTIDPCNEKAPTTAVVKENELLKLPANPTKKGYTFAGWYLADEPEKAVSARTKVSDEISDAQRNIKIEAKWISAGENGKIDIADMLLVESDEEGYPAQVYTGKKLSPKITLKNGQKALKNKTDYVVTYGDETHNNIAMGAKTGSILIEGCGSYTGSIQIYFDIYGDISKASVGEYNQNKKLTKFAPRNIEDYPNSESVELLTEEGGTSTVVVQFMKAELVQGTDYELVYSSNKEAGTAYVTVVGKGNYRGSKETAFTIQGTDISKLKYESVAPVTYTGQEIRCLYAENKEHLTAEQLATADGEIVAQKKQGGKYVDVTLQKDVDYVVRYSNNMNAGTASVTFVGIGKYMGSKTLTFKILPRNLAGVEGEYEAVQGIFEAGTSLSYTGAAIKPTLAVKAQVDEDTVHTLSEGIDYKIKYSNNTKQSEDITDIRKKPTVILTGTKNYKGSISLNFEIAKADISDAEVDVISDQKVSGKKPEPKPVVKYMGRTLKSGTDYSLSYSYQTDAETGEETGLIQITGKNNFAQSGVKEVVFRIKEQLITDKGISIKVSNLVYNGSKGDSMPTVSVTKNNGKETLLENIHYEVSYNSNINAGKKKTITVRGIGSYGGSKTLTYDVTAKNINTGANEGNPDVVCLTDYSDVNFLYTGNAVTPKVTVVDQKILVNGEPKILTENQDYTLKYSNNSMVTTNKDATVTIVGKGNYTGTLQQKVSFKIVSWNLDEQIDNGTAQIEIEDKDYTGKALKPMVTITVKQPDGSVEEVKNGKAYSVKYRNNLNVADKAEGDAAPTAIITPNNKGISGNVIDGKIAAVEQTFTIRPLRLEDAVIKGIADQTYKGKEIKPVPNVKIGKITLSVKKGDFVCTYENQNKKGIAKVIIHPGKNGNFAGQNSVEYFIK